MSKKIWTIIIGVGLILLGGFLIFEPNQTFENLIYYLGLTILVVGILKVISSIMNRSVLSATSDISSGILNMLFGILLMNTTNFTVNLISTFLGIWLILSASFSLLFMFKFRNIPVVSYKIFKEIIKLVLGIIILTTPIITTIFTGLVLGIILIIIGISTLINLKTDEKVYKVRIK